MVEIKKFTETDQEFKELARIDNLVNHDFIAHPDNDKNSWEMRDKSIIRDRLLIYNSNIIYIHNDAIFNNMNFRIFNMIS